MVEEHPPQSPTPSTKPNPDSPLPLRRESWERGGQPMPTCQNEKQPPAGKRVGHSDQFHPRN